MMKLTRNGTGVLIVPAADGGVAVLYITRGKCITSVGKHLLHKTAHNTQSTPQRFDNGPVVVCIHRTTTNESI